MAQPQKLKALNSLKIIIEELRKQGQTLLPSENELINQLKVGRNTLRSAVAQMVEQGDLKRIQGRGTFVTTNKVSLIFSNWAGTEFVENPLVDQFSKEFSHDEEGIKIQNESIPYTLYVQKILQHFLHNEPTDILQVTPFWLQRFKHLEALMPLTSYVSNQLPGTHYKEALDLNIINNEVYAIDWALCPQVLYYNKVVMEQSGLDPDKPPVSMEELDYMSRRIMENSPYGVYGLSLPLDSFAFNYLQLYPFLLAFGGGFCDSIGNIIIDSQENVNALKWLSSLYRSSGAINDRDIDAGRMLFAGNRLGFLVDGPYGRGHLRRLSGKGKLFDDEYGITTIPTGPVGNGTSILLTHSLAVSQHCSYPDEALKWIDFLCNTEDNSKRYFDDFGMIPSSKDFLQKPYFADDPFASVLIQQLENVSVGPVHHPLFIKSLPFLLQTMPRIIIGGEPVEKELRFLREVINMIGQDKTMIYL